MYAKFATEGVYQPDHLINGNAHLLVGRKVVIAAGQQLPRGAVLGKVTDANAATATAGASNVGQASMGTVTVADGSAAEGTYTATITAIKDGTTAATFSVTAPGGATASGSVGTKFDALGISFTITEGTNPNEAALGDKWTIVVTASNGEYRLSASAASDGSQTPDCILAQDVDSSAGDVQAMAYIRGDFNASALTIGDGHSAAALADALRSKGIAVFVGA